MSQSPNDYNKYQTFYQHDLWYVVGYLVGILFCGFVLRYVLPIAVFQYLFLAYLVLPPIYGLHTMTMRFAGLSTKGRRRQDSADLKAYRARPKRIFNYKTGKVEEK